VFLAKGLLVRRILPLSFGCFLIVVSLLVDVRLQAQKNDGKLQAFFHDPFLPDAPDFELKTLDGKTVRLSDYHGKAVLLNFWATWCAPCKAEMPWFMEMQKQYGPQGFQVVGIAMDQSPGTVRKFVNRMGVNYAILMGTEQVAKAYRAPGLPVTFYIDRAGKITDQATGATTRNTVEGEVKLALRNAHPISSE
jgi:peroxiredoxin